MQPFPGDFTRYEPLRRLGHALRRQGYRFVTVGPATHARINARSGRNVAEDLRDVFGWSLPFGEGLLPGGMLALMEEADVLAHSEDGWRSRARFSTLGPDLYLHSAYPTCDGAAVFFGPDTYRYARCIEQFLANRKTMPARVADIGCGGGAGAIAVAHRAPEAMVHAGDINPAALNCTAVNASLAGVRGVLPCLTDLLSGVEGDFDLITANPPYLNDTAGRLYRHGGGAMGEALSLAILDTALRRLRPGGSLLLYTGVAIIDGDDPFLREASRRLRDRDVEWRYAEIDPDVFGEELEAPTYAGAERIAAVQLTVTLPGTALCR